MDELIVKNLQERATEIEVRQLERWRGESEKNEMTYRFFEWLWEASGGVDCVAVPPSPAPDVVLQKAEARRAQARKRATRRAVFRSPFLGYGMAAAAAIALLLLSGPGVMDSEGNAAGVTPVGSTSGSGENTTLRLSDGSVVRVASGTQVEFPESDQFREVALDGKAFFAVAEDPAPFVVRTRFGAIRAEGTRFEVLAGSQALRVVVVEGKVVVDGGRHEVDAEAGEVAYLSPGADPRLVIVEDAWSLLEWGGGLLIFQSTPLSTVAGELARHFGRVVRVPDRELSERRLTAYFEDDPLEEVIASICLVVGVQCEVADRWVRIGR